MPRVSRAAQRWRVPEPLGGGKGDVGCSPTCGREHARLAAGGWRPRTPLLTGGRVPRAALDPSHCACRKRRLRPQGVHRGG